MMRFASAWVLFVSAAAGLPSQAAAQSLAPGGEVETPADVQQDPSDAARVVMDWVLASKDNGGLPYMVIDKVAAELFVFNDVGEFVARTPVLLGSAKGDESAPGIGDRELRNIARSERTTPAGRFVAKFGRASGNQKVIWVDWATAVSLHPVPRGMRKERRLERLASSTPADNRITYGCINVPTALYREVIAPLLADTAAVVYILPENRSLSEVFWAAGDENGLSAVSRDP
jgi:hypothetical protein